MINSFKEILAWQKAHELTLAVYDLVKDLPKGEEFVLSSQIRRCAISIPSNIAEGFRRRSLKDSKHFYNIAQGSLEELKYQVLLARDLKYIKDSQYNKLNSLAEEVSKLINAWSKSQKY